MSDYVDTSNIITLGRHVMRKRVKLEDIAKVVGISKMAVSLALRDHPSISEKTTKKVKKVAEELGYVPNRLAQSLVKGKSNTLAMMRSGPLQDEYQNQILRGAIPYAMSRGYTIFVGPMAQPQLESMYIEKYKNMMVDGFLGFHSITDNRINSENYQQLKDEGIPFVLYTKYFPDMETDYVVCNDFLGGYMMTKHLIELGHKEIGFVYGDLLFHSSEVQERIRGFQYAMEEHGIPYNSDSYIPFHLHFHTKTTEDILTVNETFTKQLTSEKRPTALFVCNDIAASSVYIALKKLGLSIPEDISIGGYEGVYLGSIIDPPLTTIATPIEEIGEQACKILIDKLEGIIPSSTFVKVKLDPKLQVRNSTAPPKLIT